MSVIAHARAYADANVHTLFGQRRLDGLNKLTLNDLLKQVNPYPFHSGRTRIASRLVEQWLSACLAHDEEALFDEFLKGLAASVCRFSFGGVKSTAEGMALEFSRDGHWHVVSIKSGVNGCCYWRDASPEKQNGHYSKLCGQDFWELISGRPELYVELIEPLGHEAHQRNETFAEAYAAVSNKFTLAFAQSFCREAGDIDWPKLLAFNSGSLRLAVSAQVE